MKTGSMETLRPVLHLNSCWKKLQFAAVDDFWVFPNEQNEIRNVLMLVQKYLRFWRSDAYVREVLNSHAGLQS
jgi:hypothetical protein